MGRREGVQGRGSHPRLPSFTLPVGCSFHHAGKKREGDASCQWGRRGEIPGAACLDRKRWRNARPDFPRAQTPGKGSGQEGWRLDYKEDFLILKSPQRP